MAVLKAKFVKRGAGDKQRAKASVRYIQHRPGKDGEKIIRKLFGRDGAIERSDAYRMIDDKGRADTLFKFIISPDPDKEDQSQDLNMREITGMVMLKIEEILDKTVLWAAAVHADHTDKRHVHALAVVTGKLYSSHFNLLIHEAPK